MFAYIDAWFLLNPFHSTCPWSVHMLRSFDSVASFEDFSSFFLFHFFALFSFHSWLFFCFHVSCFHSCCFLQVIFSLQVNVSAGRMMTTTTLNLNEHIAVISAHTYVQLIPRVCSVHHRSEYLASSLARLSPSPSTAHSVILAFFVCNLEVEFFFLSLATLFLLYIVCCCCCFGTFYKSVQCLVFFFFYEWVDFLSRSVCLFCCISLPPSLQQLIQSLTRSAWSGSFFLLLLYVISLCFRRLLFFSEMCRAYFILIYFRTAIWIKAFHYDDFFLLHIFLCC